MIQHENIFTETENGGATVGQAAGEWLSIVEKTRKYATYRKYFNIYHLHIAPYFAECKINAIKKETVNYYLAKQAVNGGIRGKKALSDSIVRSIRQVLNQIFKHASHIYGTETIDFSFYRYQNSPKKIKILNGSQCADLIHYLSTKPDCYKLGIVVCLYTGLRLGEICALKWGDFDWKQKLVYIHSTVQRIQTDEGKRKTRLLTNEPKSSSSVRYIPVPDELAELLMPHKKGAERYILSGDKPTEPRTYQYKFKNYLKEAGVEEVNFHILRHTFATKCVQAGFDMKCLSEILGHSSVQVTMDRYVHPTLEMKRVQMNLIQFFS